MMTDTPEALAPGSLRKNTHVLTINSYRRWLYPVPREGQSVNRPQTPDLHIDYRARIYRRNGEAVYPQWEGFALANELVNLSI